MLAVLIALAAVLHVEAAAAQDFYRNKTITLIAGQPPGGGIDSEMRLVALFLGKFIPGEPKVLPMNMQGAGGIILGNYLYSVAKPDGLTLGMPGRTGFALAPIISAADTKYDLRRFTWIGSSAASNFVLYMRRAANVKSFEDLRNAKRQIVIAGSGSTTANSVMPEVLARYEKLPLRVVRGYPGINDAVLAVERGEADGVLCQKASLRADLIASGAVVPVFQVMAFEPGVPLLDDLITDQKEKALLDLLSAPQRLGLPLIAPPGLPSDVTRILRQSYLNMVADKGYQEEAVKRGLDIGQPNSGEELAQFAAKLTAFPAETVEEYRRYVEHL
jgi:ABC-type amino acid transport substrate-binding protein